MRIIGREIEGTEDYLPGFSKASIFIKNKKYFRAVIFPGKRLKGRRVLVSGAELKDIDSYEGVEYKRKRVILGSSLEAWVYA